MRKIIITVIATFFMIAPFEKVKGQSQIVITSANFPTVNILTGANAKLSLGLWRFEPFMRYGVLIQLFEERVEYEYSVSYSGRFAIASNPKFGLGFRITERDMVRFGMTIIEPMSGLGYVHFSLEYVHKRNLSERTSLDLFGGIVYSGSSWGGRGWFEYSGVEFGVRWNYEIVRNLNFGIRLAYTRFLSWSAKSANHWRGEVVNADIFIDNVTRNLIDFSIGIHYHLGRRQQQQAPQRPPRQQVSPRHRALPCPPGQMRHNRSWDRPSSVFNHPTAR